MPCSGAQRRGEALDEVSAAIPGDGVAGNDNDHRACANDLTICFHPERTLRCIALFGVLNARQRTVNVVVETYLPSGAIPTRRSVLPSRSP